MKRRSFFAFIIIVVCFSLIFSALACDTDKIVDEGEKDQSGDVSGEVTDPSDEDKEDQDTDQDTEEDTGICSHVDANKDGICDKCGSSVDNDKEECTHEDKNGDGICDKCGSNVENDKEECTHEDKNGDGICDKCGSSVDNDKEECTHEDKNGDGICDLCGEKLYRVVDYDDYSAEIISSLEKENVTPSNISEWSVSMQDALKEYLDTNYGEKFMTGDTVLDRMTDKSIVGYDFDFENNTLTALVQATSSANTINYRQRSIKINSVYDFVREYLTNNDIKQKYGDLTNSYEDEAGNMTVFVNDGQKLDFSSTAIIEGKYDTSYPFATTRLNQSSNYAPSEYEAVKDVYNFIFSDEQYEKIEKLLFATEGSTYGTTRVLGKEGYTFSSTMLYYNIDGQLTTTRMYVETPSNGAIKFTDISKDGVYMQDYAIHSNTTKIFGNGQTIVRVVCLEQE